MRSMMSCLILAGSGLLPVTPSIMAAISTLPEPIDGQCSYMRPSNPRRLKFGPVGNDQQHAKGSYPVHGLDRDASRLVGSVQCASSKIISTGFCATSASICVVSASSVRCRRCFGGKFERGIASIVRQRQHFGKECHVLA